jgi:hypothetical protein
LLKDQKVRKQNVRLTYTTDGKWPAEFRSRFEQPPRVERACNNEEHNKYHCANHRWNIVPEIGLPFMHLENGHLEMSFQQDIVGDSGHIDCLFELGAKRKKTINGEKVKSNQLKEFKNKEGKMIEASVVFIIHSCSYFTRKVYNTRV